MSCKWKCISASFVLAICARNCVVSSCVSWVCKCVCVLLAQLQHRWQCVWHCPIDGVALSWIQLYQWYRYQIVIVNGMRSEPFRLWYGVPQSSVLLLGSVLSVLYYKATWWYSWPPLGMSFICRWFPDAIQTFQLCMNVFLVLTLSHGWTGCGWMTEKQTMLVSCYV